MLLGATNTLEICLSARNYMNDPLDTTVALVRRSKEGDSEALNLLFKKYLERVHYLVRLRIGKGLRGHLESQDIVQEAMIRGLKAFDKFEMRHEGAFLHWLSKLVENVIRDKADYLNAAKRSVSAESPLEDDREDDAASMLSKIRGADPTPSTILVRDEQLVRLERALEKLTDEHREVILQREIENLSFKEIGENMTRSEDASRMLYVRAKTDLARLLGNAD